MQEMVYFKAIQKSAPMRVSVSGTTDQKTYLKKFRRASAPLTPLDPPMVSDYLPYALAKCIELSNSLNDCCCVGQYRKCFFRG